MTACSPCGRTSPTRAAPSASYRRWTAEDIRPEWSKHLTAMAEGRTRLLVAGSTTTAPVAATAFLSFNTHRLMTHWVWLYTVMVHPRHQGKGYGRDLLAAAEEAAAGFDGIEAIRLTCRGGEGLERFYGSLRLQGGRPGARRDPGRTRRRPRRHHDAAAARLPRLSRPCRLACRPRPPCKIAAPPCFTGRCPLGCSKRIRIGRVD